MLRSLFRPNGGVSIIAEPANTHNGSPEYLAELTRAVKAAGADAIKYQIFAPDHLAVPDYEWYKVYEQICFPLTEWEKLIALGKSQGLAIVAEVFDASAARFCIEQQVDAFKINIGDLANRALLEALGDAHPVFLSVGGSYVEEVRRAIATLQRGGRSILLHYGVQAYPTKRKDTSLAKVRSLSICFGLPVCFADHIAGDDPLAIHLPGLGVAAGATAVEKHVILKRETSRHDYYSAVEPDQFAAMVQQVRAIEECHGDGLLELNEAEQAYRELHKKCPVLRRDLPAGHALQEEDVELKRADGAKDFTCLEDVVGKTLSTALRARSPLRQEHVA